MKRVIRSSTSEKVRYEFQKPALKNYVFTGELDRNNGQITGQILKLAAYDDADYAWAKIYPGSVAKFIIDGKVVDKMHFHSYDEDDYETVDDYFNGILDSVADELHNINKGVSPRMMHY